MSKLVELIKQAANESNESGYPASVVIGTVISKQPLQIQVSQKLILTSQFLILAERVTDHTVNVTHSFTTQEKSGGGGEASFASHSHDVSCNTLMTVHGALEVGEKVIMIREQGGQKYFVIDRKG